jgi:hypothetical protein
MLMRADPGAVGEKMMAAPPSDCGEASLARAGAREMGRAREMEPGEGDGAGRGRWGKGEGDGARAREMGQGPMTGWKPIPLSRVGSSWGRTVEGVCNKSVPGFRS